jgi:hypothetical protein
MRPAVAPAKRAEWGWCIGRELQTGLPFAVTIVFAYYAIEMPCTGGILARPAVAIAATTENKITRG